MPKKKKKKLKEDIQINPDSLIFSSFDPGESIDLGTEYGLRITHKGYNITVEGTGKVQARLRDRLMRELKKQIRLRYKDAGKDVGTTNN